MRVLAKLFRGQVKAAFSKANLLAHVPAHVWHQPWVTHCAPAGTGSEGITSLAPSIRRLAITNTRIEKLEDGHVTFRFTERVSQEWKHRTLPAAAFIRRFLSTSCPRVLSQSDTTAS